jgi:hypothetical protein
MDMKSISQKLQDDIRKIMEGNVDEALIGKQRNIDTNHNGKIDAEDFVKLRAMKKTPSGKVHNCATHVEHAVLGKGVTVSEEHAEPDADGNIEWYTVQFENTMQKVLTKDLTITMSESHEHKAKKDNMEEANIQPTSAKSRSHVGNLSHPTTNSVVHPSSGKEIGLITKQSNGQYHAHPSSVKMSHHESGTFDTKDQAHQFIRNAHAKAIKNGTLSDSWKKSKPLPHLANKVEEETQLYEKDEGKPGLMFKKIAAKAAARYGSVEAGNRVAGAIRKKVLAKEGVEVTEEEIDAMFEAYTVEAANRAQQAAIAISLIKAGKKDGKMPKPMKEEEEQFEYSFADYLNVVRAKYGEEDAILIANEAFKNRDIALFDIDSQSPEA